MSIKNILKKVATSNICISIIGTTVLFVMFFFWYLNECTAGVYGRVASLVVTVLFAFVCINFVPQWTEYWSGKNIFRTSFQYNEFDDASSEKEINKTAVKIFFVLILTNIAVIVAVFLMRCLNFGAVPFLESLDFWKMLDSGHYLAIAEDWYLSEGEWDRLVQLVFLPGYPVLIKIVNYIFGNYLYSALVIASLCFAAAGSMFYKLLRIDFCKKDALRAIKYLCIFPASFFFAAPMSESLFLFISVSCIYFSRKHKWFTACLFGGYAAFTRSLGIVLLVPVIIEFVHCFRLGAQYIKTKKEIARWIISFLSLLIIAAGLVAYLFINYKVSGDPFKFSEYQKEHWGQSLGYFFNTAAYQTENLISYFEHSVTTSLGLWLPNVIVCFFSLCVMIPASRKLNPGYTAYFIAYYFIAVGTTWLLSAPRYMAALITLPVAVSVITKKPKIDAAMTILFGVMYALYLYAFIMRWQVW